MKLSAEGHLMKRLDVYGRGVSRICSLMDVTHSPRMLVTARRGDEQNSKSPLRFSS